MLSEDFVVVSLVEFTQRGWKFVSDEALCAGLLLRAMLAKPEVGTCPPANDYE